MNFENFLSDRNYKASTIESYVRKIKKLDADLRLLLDKAIDDSELKDVNNLISDYESKYSKDYVLNAIKILNLYFDYRKTNIIIDKRYINCRKSTKNRVYKYDNVKKAISKDLPLTHKAILTMIYTYNLSVSDVLNIKVSDFDKSLEIIKLKKKLVKLQDTDIDMISLLSENKREYLFENEYGRRISRATFYNIISHYEIKNTPKMNKKKKIMDMLKSGTDIEEIKKEFNYKSYSFINKVKGGE